MKFLVFLCISSSFGLSLNKSDRLEGEDEPLQHFGIIHGDQIFVLSDQPELAAAPEGDQNNSSNGTNKESRERENTSPKTMVRILI